MNEMLANQYFMMRKYLAASKELEEVLHANPAHYPSMKKLIICYTQTNRPAEAIDLFYRLISSNIETVINTDPVSDDCPCPGLIGDVESDSVRYEDKFTKLYVLGILWLYCDISVSLKYFKLAYEADKENHTIPEIIRIYEEYIEQTIH